MQTCKVYSSLDSIHSLKNDWIALLKYDLNASFFQTWEWHYCWLETFTPQPHTVLYIITVWQHDNLIGIAPLIYKEKSKILQFISAPTGSDYADFIIDERANGVLEIILEYIFNLKNWQEFILHNFRQHSINYPKILNWLNKNHPYFLNKFLYDAPTHIFNHNTNLSPKEKFRYFNWFKRHGKLEFKRLTTEKEINNYLPKFYQSHIKRWEKTKSKFLKTEYKNFFKQLVQTLTPLKRVHLTVLELNNEPIAYDFSFVYKNSFIYYKPTYNLKYKKKSAGKLLIKYLVEYCIKNEIKELDFSIGSENYKYQTANKIYKIQQIKIFKSKLRFIKYNYLDKLRDLLHKSPKLHKFICKIRGL
jgi:CelD/BcsL family acetyltransferase involved in cellulose biosynthesis